MVWGASHKEITSVTLRQSISCYFIYCIESPRTYFITANNLSINKKFCSNPMELIVPSDKLLCSHLSMAGRKYAQVASGKVPLEWQGANSAPLAGKRTVHPKILLPRRERGRKTKSWKTQRNKERELSLAMTSFVWIKGARGMRDEDWECFSL